MAHKQHTLEQALHSLGNKRDVEITGGRIITTLSRKSKFRTNDLGNGSWGNIDYLVKAHGYAHIQTDRF